MNKKMLRNIGLLLLAPLVMMGPQCPEFPNLEDVAITLVTTEYIELSFESTGTININTESDIAEINTADIRQQLEDADVSVDSLEAIVISRVIAGCTAINFEEDEAGLGRNLTNLTVYANRLNADGDSISTTTLVQSWRSATNPLFIFPLSCANGCSGDFAAEEDVETVDGGCWITVPVEETAVDYFNTVLDEVLTTLQGDPANDKVIRFMGVASGNSNPSEDFTSFTWKVRIYYDVSGKVVVEAPRT